MRGHYFIRSRRSLIIAKAMFKTHGRSRKKRLNLFSNDRRLGSECVTPIWVTPLKRRELRRPRYRGAGLGDGLPSHHVIPTRRPRLVGPSPVHAITIS